MLCLEININPPLQYVFVCICADWPLLHPVRGLVSFSQMLFGGAGYGRALRPIVEIHYAVYWTFKPKDFPPPPDGCVRTCLRLSNIIIINTSEAVTLGHTYSDNVKPTFSFLLLLHLLFLQVSCVLSRLFDEKKNTFLSLGFIFCHFLMRACVCDSCTPTVPKLFQ